MWAIPMLESKRKPLPEWYINQPQIEPFDYFYMEAFQELSTERQMGMGLGPIPNSKIKEYASDCGFDVLLRDAFIFIIRAMDNAFLAWYNKQQEEKVKKAKAKK